MSTDIIIYVSCGIMILLALVTPLLNIFFRRPVPKKGTGIDKPSFSIIIAVHDNAQELERHLPLLLSQQYDGDFEIIVVESKTGDRTEEIIKRFSDDKRLYSTFIPSSSKYMSRKKLALTVGAKAAKYEWLIFIDAECYPENNMWLDTLAQGCTDNKELAIGYSNYDKDASDYQRFCTMVNILYALKKADRGTGFRNPAQWIAIRRVLFMDNKGFEGNLMLLRGEYDFLVNKFSEKGNTAVITDEKGKITIDAPTIKTWKNKKLYYMETRRHLKRRFSYGSIITADNTLMYVTYLSLIAGLVAGFLTDCILLCVIAIISIIANVSIRLFLAHKTLKMYNEDIPLWKIIPFELSNLFTYIKYKIKYKFSDKFDFTSHKL